MRSNRDKGLKVVKAKQRLGFRVEQCNIKNGKPGSKNLCVLADALKDTFGETVQGFEVGTKITKIYVAGQVTKYRTPTSLQKTLRLFDKTGRWNLPVGQYYLEPYPKSASKGRHDLKNPNRRGKFQARSLPTRQVEMA